MTRWNRKNALRFTSATVLALAMFAAATARAQQPADLSVYEVNGTRYLAGCVTTELADRLIAEHGFKRATAPSASCASRALSRFTVSSETNPHGRPPVSRSPRRGSRLSVTKLVARSAVRLAGRVACTTRA